MRKATGSKSRALSAALASSRAGTRCSELSFCNNRSAKSLGGMSKGGRNRERKNDPTAMFQDWWSDSSSRKGHEPCGRISFSKNKSMKSVLLVEPPKAEQEVKSKSSDGSVEFEREHRVMDSDLNTLSWRGTDEFSASKRGDSALQSGTSALGGVRAQSLWQIHTEAPEIPDFLPQSGKMILQENGRWEYILPPELGGGVDALYTDCESMSEAMPLKELPVAMGRPGLCAADEGFYVVRNAEKLPNSKSITYGSRPAVPIKMRMLRRGSPKKVLKQSVTPPVPGQGGFVGFRLYQVQKPVDSESRRVVAYDWKMRSQPVLEYKPEQGGREIAPGSTTHGAFSPGSIIQGGISFGSNIQGELDFGSTIRGGFSPSSAIQGGLAPGSTIQEELAHEQALDWQHQKFTGDRISSKDNLDMKIVGNAIDEQQEQTEKESPNSLITIRRTASGKSTLRHGRSFSGAIKRVLTDTKNNLERGASHGQTGRKPNRSVSSIPSKADTNKGNHKLRVEDKKSQQFDGGKSLVSIASIGNQLPQEERLEQNVMTSMEAPRNELHMLSHHPSAQHESGRIGEVPAAITSERIITPHCCHRLPGMFLFCCGSSVPAEFNELAAGHGEPPYPPKCTVVCCDKPVECKPDCTYCHQDQTAYAYDHYQQHQYTGGAKNYQGNKYNDSGHQASQSMDQQQSSLHGSVPQAYGSTEDRYGKPEKGYTGYEYVKGGAGGDQGSTSEYNNYNKQQTTGEYHDSVAHAPFYTQGGIGGTMQGVSYIDQNRVSAESVKTMTREQQTLETVDLKHKKQEGVFGWLRSHSWFGESDKSEKGGEEQKKSDEGDKQVEPQILLATEVKLPYDASTRYCSREPEQVPVKLRIITPKMPLEGLSVGPVAESLVNEAEMERQEEPIRFRLLQVQKPSDKETQRIVAFIPPAHPAEITEDLRQRSLERVFDYTDNDGGCRPNLRSISEASDESVITMRFEHRTTKVSLLPDDQSTVASPLPPNWPEVSEWSKSIAEQAAQRVAARRKKFEDSGYDDSESGRKPSVHVNFADQGQDEIIVKAYEASDAEESTSEEGSEVISTLADNACEALRGRCWMICSTLRDDISGDGDSESDDEGTSGTSSASEYTDTESDGHSLSQTEADSTQTVCIDTPSGVTSADTSRGVSADTSRKVSADITFNLGNVSADTSRRISAERFPLGSGRQAYIQRGDLSQETTPVSTHKGELKLSSALSPAPLKIWRRNGQDNGKNELRQKSFIGKSPMETSHMQKSPVQTSPIPTSPIPTSPIPTSSIPTSSIPTSSIPTSPIQKLPIQKSPIRTSPVQKLPVQKSSQKDYSGMTSVQEPPCGSICWSDGYVLSSRGTYADVDSRARNTQTQTQETLRPNIYGGITEGLYTESFGYGVRMKGSTGAGSVSDINISHTSKSVEDQTKEKLEILEKQLKEMQNRGKQAQTSIVDFLLPVRPAFGITHPIDLRVKQPDGEEILGVQRLYNEYKIPDQASYKKIEETGKNDDFCVFPMLPINEKDPMIDETKPVALEDLPFNVQCAVQQVLLQQLSDQRNMEDQNTNVSKVIQDLTKASFQTPTQEYKDVYTFPSIHSENLPYSSRDIYDISTPTTDEYKNIQRVPDIYIQPPASDTSPTTQQNLYSSPQQPRKIYPKIEKQQTPISIQTPAPSRQITSSDISTSSKVIHKKNVSTVTDSIPCCPGLNCLCCSDICAPGKEYQKKSSKTSS